MINNSIKKLITYGLETGLIEQSDKVYVTNQVLAALKLDEYVEPDAEYKDVSLEETLDEILNFACENGLCEDSIVYRDLFDTKIMGLLTPRPSEVNKHFWKFYKYQLPKVATDGFYKFSQDNDYIRRYRISKDIHWVTSTEYGDIDISINLSKPEKDPKAIAAAKNAKQSGYPKCLLCYENVGYAGRIDSPARQNHRVISLNIDGNEWGFQYSPYVYYNEHCIVFNKKHTPMVIDKAAFTKLFSFVKQFPHYFVGSNADLPIVGGSILSHEHFQGGNYEFAMAKAPLECEFKFEGFDNVKAGIVHWPMSVIRLSGASRKPIIELADKILTAWRGYTDEEAFIFAQTNDETHNTITPIARMKNGQYELDLVLRNNITTDEHPLGVYHPHTELHHIKKENIGLIEVMGLAVLPSRLKDELNLLADALISGDDLRANETLAKHADWAEEFSLRNKITSDNVYDIIQTEVGNVFTTVLEHAGVFKSTDEGRKFFARFIETIK